MIIYFKLFNDFMNYLKIKEELKKSKKDLREFVLKLLDPMGFEFFYHGIAVFYRNEYLIFTGDAKLFMN